MLIKDYINRELSWLDFNQRVLYLALRQDIPVLERLKFLAIVSSNFDEFQVVRIANLINDSEQGDPIRCPSGLRQSEILDRALKKIAQIEEIQYRCLNDQIYPLLAKQGMMIHDFTPHGQYKDYYYRLFMEQIQPLLTPLSTLNEHFDQNWIHRGVLHLYIRFIKDEEEKEWIIPLPENLPRFQSAPDNRGFLLTEAVAYNQINQMVPGAKILNRGVFRVLRDADLSVDEKRDENFMKAMEEILENRSQSRPIILEHMLCSDEVIDRLERLLEIPKERSFGFQGPLRLSDCFSLLGKRNSQDLLYPPYEPVRHPAFTTDMSPWRVLMEKDVLLHHPYESFAPVTHILQQAAQDPKVLAIKMTLYRTSGDSPVIQALLDAAEKGKQVTVLVELKARFDEKRNIQWARKLSKAGALVIYGIAGLKVHAKVLLILRSETAGIRRYLHLGTGNYNDKTAELYTDFSLMTSRDELTSEAAQFFNALTGYSDPPLMRQLSMAPFSLRSRLKTLIEREISWAEQGEEAYFMAKLNSLNDPEMVELLYRASDAGVKIDLNIRGICSVIPGIPGRSDNIRVISIIGRYLEHARGYYFLNGGQEEVYLSSADWMPRNLNRRVELLFPVLDKKLRDQVKMVLDTTFNDNSHAFQLNAEGTWNRLDNAGEEKLTSQQFFQQFYSKRSARAQTSQRDQLKVRKEIPMGD